MERPAKRRKVLGGGPTFADLDSLNHKTHSRTEDTLLKDTDALKQQLSSKSPLLDKRTVFSPHIREILLPADRAKPANQEIHQRGHDPYETVGMPAQPVIQPVETVVSSFINVVLDQGGTSVGNVLVPAQSTIFNLDGYGPITLNSNPTPTPQPGNAPSPSQPHQQPNTAQPTSQQQQQTGPSAAASSPMTIQVPGSSSQVILSSPPTPLPPSPSNSTSTDTTSESYFGSLTSSQTTSSTQTTSSSGITSTSTPSQTSNGGLLHPSGNLTTSPAASSTIAGGGVGGIGEPTSTSSGPSSSSSSAAAGSGDDNTPSTPAVVGGVVGGVAGLALILLVLLYFLRRRKRVGQQRNISPPIPQSASTGPGANTGTMTERSSAAVPLATAGFFRRLRPGSGATASTTETTPSERGFQNLGGRKLESVLASRGDGYGDIPFGSAGAISAPGPASGRGPPPGSIPIITAAPGSAPGHSSPESLGGSSFYRDSQGFYGGPGPSSSPSQGQGQPAPEPASNSSSMFVGPGSPPQSPTHPPPPITVQTPEGVPVMRPGPARTPVTTQGGLSPLRGPPRPQRNTPPPPQIPGTIQERPRDGVGRSHPSMDGSRGSRFAENI
ncbi:MAG: hypothetical protein Q9220_001863 [cf. Caloplaca sp. 1 TL-2023]